MEPGSIRRGQWVIIAGKNVGIVDQLATMGEVHGAMVAPVDENGDNIAHAPMFIQTRDLEPVTNVQDIPAPRRAHLPPDYNPVTGRGALAQAMTEQAGPSRSKFVPSKRHG